jgi:hypothetical protein
MTSPHDFGLGTCQCVCCKIKQGVFDVLKEHIGFADPKKPMLSHDEFLVGVMGVTQALSLVLATPDSPVERDKLIKGTCRALKHEANRSRSEAVRLQGRSVTH